jgi:hypothetical protein
MSGRGKSKSPLVAPPPTSVDTPQERSFLLYTAPNGAVKVDVAIEGESVWLTQKSLAELFGVKRPAITKHLKNILETGELTEASVCSKKEHTAADGKLYQAYYYDLDALEGNGRVSAVDAKRKAEAEYEVFRVRQDVDYVSDFDREVKRLLGEKKP